MSTAKDLAAYLAACDRPFDWASWNCCHFASGWVKKMTGVDPMEGLPETPTAQRAHRLVRALGGIVEAWSERLGRRPIVPALAQYGDLVLFQRNAAMALGICCGRTAVFIDEGGCAVHLPMAEAMYAWRLRA